jgi:hypothetical protein
LSGSVKRKFVGPCKLDGEGDGLAGCGEDGGSVACKDFVGCEERVVGVVCPVVPHPVISGISKSVRSSNTPDRARRDLSPIFRVIRIQILQRAITCLDTLIKNIIGNEFLVKPFSKLFNLRFFLRL